MNGNMTAKNVSFSAENTSFHCYIVTTEEKYPA